MHWFIDILHSLIRFNYNFKKVEPLFEPRNWDYLQSLSLWSNVVQLLGVLLLVVLIVVWSVKCCCPTNGQSKRTRSRQRRVTALLFTLILIDFVLLGACLYGNDRVNRGLNSAARGMKEIARQMELSSSQTASLNKTIKRNYTGELEKFATFLGNHTKEKLNETLVQQIHKSMQNISDSVDKIENILLELANSLGEFSFLKKVQILMERIEFERWLFYVIIFCLVIAILFGGAISFCTHSKKGVVLFSALSFALFVIVWLLFSVTFGISMAVADYCANPTPFTRKYLNQSAQEALKFYDTCTDKNDALPPSFGKLLSVVDRSVADMQTSQNDMSATLPKLFNVTAEAVESKKYVGKMVTILAGIQKNVGGLEGFLQCRSFYSDSRLAYQGLCSNGMLAIFLLLVAMLLFSAVFFLILCFVSCAWSAYTKKPIEYVEVDEDDPFLPRGERSTIPVDVYGTHMYNPRTRFQSSGDSDVVEQPRSTLLAGGSQNSTLRQQNGANSNLSAVGPPMWQRGAAPPACLTQTCNRAMGEPEPQYDVVER